MFVQLATIDAGMDELKAKEAESVETLSQYKEEIGWRERLQGDEEVLEEIRCESRHSFAEEGNLLNNQPLLQGQVSG